MYKIIFKILFFSLLLSTSFASEKINVFKFTEEELKTLKVRKVRGADSKTEYIVGKNENGNFLKAIANNAASGLGKEIKIDLNNKIVFYS